MMVLTPAEVGLMTGSAVTHHPTLGGTVLERVKGKDYKVNVVSSLDWWTSLKLILKYNVTILSTNLKHKNKSLMPIPTNQVFFLLVSSRPY
jgi:hypothetical protein